MWGMADPAKDNDYEERRGTADDERLPTGNAEKSPWRFECKCHET